MAFMYRLKIMRATFQSARSAVVGRPLSEAYIVRIFGTARSSSSAPRGENRFTSDTSLARSACLRRPGASGSM